MITTEAELEQAIAQLRTDGSDSWDVEVKRASGGTPSMGETLCAFANMPEGGSVIFGLDEATGFAPVGVRDPAELEDGIASQARQGLDPPVQVSFWRVQQGGVAVVVANVGALPSYQRPCTMKSTKKAYLRFSDGDYELSDQEVQQMLSLRERPRHDVAAMDGSSMGDLDQDLTEQFLRSARASSARLDREDDEQILRMKRVLEPGGRRLTVAGIYALGRYPQQFLPSLSLTAVMRPPPGIAERNTDRKEFDGPLPALLDDAVQWVVRNIRTRVRFGPDGHGYDAAEVPVIAVREIIANALVHRDLSQHTWGKDVQLILENDRLIVTNPGGLWGLTAGQLGRANAKSAVNEFLYDICQLTTTPDGNRVIEGEGGGLREVRRALRRAGMREPRFFDTGVRFTVMLPRHSLLTEGDFEWLGSLPHGEELSDIQRQVLVSMRRGQSWTNQTMRDEFGPLDSTEARTLLQGLVYYGLAEATGGGRGTSYRLRGAWRVPPGSSGGKAAPDFMTRSRDDFTGAELAETQDPRHLGVAARAAATSRHGSQLWEALRGGAKNSRQLAEETDLALSKVRYGLRRLMDEGLVARNGGQGDRQTSYRLSANDEEGA